MAGDAAALLDELMGRSRNVIPGKEVHEVEWCDAEVCKNYLCGFCPCDLFTNTRADIGTCEKVHDEKLRQKYQESDRAWKMGYEMQFLSELEKLVRSLDRRIAHGKERLRRSAEAKQKQMSGFHEDGGSDKLQRLNMDINSRVVQLEELGQRGEVEGAQVLLREVEALERERERERAGLVRDSSKTLAGFEVDANDFHEKMELCDVCGSFLVIGDSQSRVDAHLLGKQHLGYARIRAAITELKSKLSDIRTSNIESRQRPDSDGRRASREYKRHRSPSRDRRHRSRSRDKRRRSRSHSRERRRSRRSRSQERQHYHSQSRRRSRERRKSWRRRSGSKEKRSHSRGRSRSRDKRSRSREKRSRSREKRSRSRGKRSLSREKRSRSREKRSRSRGKRSHSREKRSRSKEKRPCSRGKRSHSREKRSVSGAESNAKQTCSTSLLMQENKPSEM